MDRKRGRPKGAKTRRYVEENWNPKEPVTGGSGRVYTLPDGTEISAQELTRQAWETGVGLAPLKLHALQMELYQAYHKLPPLGSQFELLARRSGKTWAKIVILEELCRTVKGAVVRYAAPTKQQAKEIVLPNWRIITEDCPLDLRAQDRTGSEGCYVWPMTGSRLYLAGTDDTDQIDRLRGPYADLIIVDELAFHHCDLKRLIHWVLSPQLATRGGKMLLCSTPPESMQHGSIEFIRLAVRTGNLIKKTIYQNPLLSDDNRRTICTQMNPDENDDGVVAILAQRKKGTPAWEREWKCELVTDENVRVVREFEPEKHVRELFRPSHFYCYTFIDLAFVKDYCAALFCYLDFKQATLVVEDEWLGKGTPSLATVASLIRAREMALYQDQVPLRYGDGTALGQQILASLTADHNLEVIPCTMLANKEAMINSLREYMGADRIFIHPRCHNLIDQLKDGIWKVKPGSGAKPEYERTEVMGHLDALDCLVYGVRMVDWQLNPTPKGKLNDYTHWVNPRGYHPNLSDQQITIAKAFGHVWKHPPGKAQA